MGYNYCYECGTKLEIKFLEHEGNIPFCPKCNDYRFPIFSSAVSMIILNKDLTKILLVKQYHKNFWRFVAGYINKGENAEITVVREMGEEVSLKPFFIKTLRTKYFEPSNTLMISYLAVVDEDKVSPNFEIDEFKWFDIKDADYALKDASLAKYFFDEFYDNEFKSIQQSFKNS